MEAIKIRRAILSVSDKDGLIGFAKFLVKSGVELIATGGTAQRLKESGIDFTPIEKITGNPEAFGGRMKTISFPFASALLFRRDNQDDVATAKQLGVQPIDLVVCNLYPFESAVKRGAPDAELVEEIDVGGPTMIRAAAKNHNSVAVCSKPSQYASVMREMDELQGALTFETRRKLAVEAFQLTAAYETAIASELSTRFLGEDLKFLRLEKGRELRYGENPHQKAMFYRAPALDGAEKFSIAGADVVQGKALSYNNLLDADAAHRAASDAHKATGKPTVAVVKHLNPCGLASAGSSLEALELAWEGDPVSAFGGILCFTESFTADCAKWLEDKFVEVIVAPRCEPEAAAILAKKKNLRVLLCSPHPSAGSVVRSVSGGVLWQDEDSGLDEEIKAVTKAPFPGELETLAHFGIMAAKHLRSNAVALVRKRGGAYQLVGAGMGQPNRIDSLKALAAPRAQAKGKLSEMLLISDAFFPFADMIEASHELGLKAIVQPGGSIRDEEVIAACDKRGIAMAFTGKRHFRH